MSTSDQARALLKAGRSYETSARELGIAPELASMLATGVPAGSSHDLHPASASSRRGCRTCRLSAFRSGSPSPAPTPARWPVSTPI
jgi:hypothetical protein